MISEGLTVMVNSGSLGPQVVVITCKPTKLVLSIPQQWPSISGTLEGWVTPVAEILGSPRHLSFWETFVAGKKGVETFPET